MTVAIEPTMVWGLGAESMGQRKLGASLRLQPPLSLPPPSLLRLQPLPSLLRLQQPPSLTALRQQPPSLTERRQLPQRTGRQRHWLQQYQP